MSFVADETDVNGYISGPINDQLGIRLAFYHENSEGYLDNPNPFTPNHRVPAETGNGGRVTLKVGFRLWTSRQVEGADHGR